MYLIFMYSFPLNVILLRSYCTTVGVTILTRKGGIELEIISMFYPSFVDSMFTNSVFGSLPFDVSRSFLNASSSTRKIHFISSSYFRF